MKLISKAAMATALALGTTAMLGAPAIAAKKEKKAEEPKLEMSAEFRKPAGEAQTALQANDLATAKAKITEAAGIAKSPDEKYVAAQILLQIGIQSKDEAVQSEAITAMIDSGRVPPADLPKFKFYAGKFAYDKKDYAKAKTLLTEAEQAGYTGTDLNLLLSEANTNSGSPQQGLAYIDKAIASEKAAGKPVPEDWYKRGISVAYQAKMMPEVAKWTRKNVEAFPTPENWRTALVIYRDNTNLDNQSTLDLMRLMRLTKSLAGERDYFEYANSAFERGIFGEVKSVIDEGKAGGMLNTTNQAISDIYNQSSAKIAADKKELAAAEREASSSNNFRVASGTADALMGYGEDARAIPLYKIALQKGATDKDTINTRIGIASVRSGDLAGARQAFSQVDQNGPRGPLVSYWNLYLDQRSGGAAASAASTGN